jgi:toxin ParE1/3/4
VAAELIWRRKARNDLIEIGLSIARENPVAAAKMLAELEARVEALRYFPRLGARRADIQRALRAFIVWPYLIFYRTFPDRDNAKVRSVQLVRVLDGRRDLVKMARLDRVTGGRRKRQAKGVDR